MGKRERANDRLNAKQMDKLSEIYDFFDKNGDGSLVRRDFVDGREILNDSIILDIGGTY